MSANVFVRVPRLETISNYFLDAPGGPKGKRYTAVASGSIAPSNSPEATSTALARRAASHAGDLGACINRHRARALFSDA